MIHYNCHLIVHGDLRFAMSPPDELPLIGGDFLIYMIYSMGVCVVIASLHDGVWMIY